MLWFLFFKHQAFNFTKKQRWAIGALLLFCAINCLFAYSRAAWISIFGVVALYQLTKIKIKAWHIVSVIGIAGLVLFTFQDEIFDTVSQNEAVSNQGDLGNHFKSVTNLQSDASNLERLNRWSCALEMFERKPWLGWGPGTYQFEYGQFQSIYTNTYISTYHGNRGNAHSEYLTYLSEAGLPGLISFCLIILVTLTRGLRLVYTAKNEQVKWLALGVLLGISTWFVHGIFNSFIDKDKMAILVFGSMAAIVALEQFHNKNLPEKETDASVDPI